MHGALAGKAVAGSFDRLRRWVGIVGIAIAAGLTTAAVAQAEIQPGTRIHRAAPNPAGDLPSWRPPGSDRGDAPGGLAGDPYAYHVGNNLLCADCHSAHFSMEHTFSGSGTVASTGAPGGDWLGDVGPNPYLLKAPSATELCLACHADKTFAPDVVGPDVNGLTQRAAGHFEDIGIPNFRGHNLSTDPDAGLTRFTRLCGRCHFGGEMATATVECVDCHNPHGNASHRNLQWASDPGAEPPLVAYVRPGDLGLARYEAENVAYAAPTGTGWRELTNLCIDCHHTFFSPDYTEAASPYLRHPGINTEWGGTAPINRAGANTDPDFWVNGGASFLVPRLKFVVLGAADFAGASVVAADNQVFCLTCHQAHGSSNPFAMRWVYGTATPEGASGCHQCHGQLLD